MRNKLRYQGRWPKISQIDHSYRTVSIWIIVWNEHLEPEDTLLEEALADENDAVPTCDEGKSAETYKRQKYRVNNCPLQSGDV